MYEDACLVELAPSRTWQKQEASPSDDIDISSSSGIFIRAEEHDFVLTHGSILISHISKNKGILKRLIKVGHIPSKTFHDLQARLTVKHKHKQVSHLVSSKLGTLSSHVKKYVVSMLEASSVCKTENDHEQFLGKIELVWKAERFARTIQAFLPASDDWSFYENPEKGSASVADNTFDSNLVAQLLPYFVLIKLDKKSKYKLHSKSDKKYLCNGNLTIGDPVHIVGTPFGAMNPPIFLNSLSQGVICNVAGTHQELIITDARCIPGSEGAPVYFDTIQQRQCLLGLVASALCWKANEWIGLSLICHIGEILHSLSDIIQLTELSTAFDSVIPKKGCKPVCGAALDPNKIPVVLVKQGSTWGSGLIIDQDQGIVLTCGHVVSGHKTVRVRVSYPTVQWYTAEVIHATPFNEVFDIGILHIEGYTPCSDWINRVTVAHQVQEGDPSYVIGHANFGHQYSLPASMTSGVISKVNMSQGLPMLIQSTCTVNAGASGGPLVASNGSIIGIVTCNARDTGTGASYPHINLSVPLTTIWPVIEDYLNTNDHCILEHLHIKSSEISDLWSMRGAAESLGAIKSKL